MKKIYLLLLGFALCQLTPAPAQVPAVSFGMLDSLGYDTYPFAKGKWVYDLRRNLKWNSFNEYSGDVKYGKASELDFYVGADYMFKRNWGVGLDLSADFSKQTNGGTTKNSDWMAWGNLTFAQPLSNRVSWYIQPGIGFGKETDKFTNTGGNTTKNVQDIFGVRVRTGLPIRLGDGPVYLNPNIFYKYESIDFDGGKEKMNRFGAQVNLIASLRCSEHRCDSKYGNRQAKMRYNQGSQYISYYSKGMFSFGDYKVDYDNLPTTDEGDLSGGHIRVDYANYFAKNFYGGLEFNVRTNTSEPSPTSKTTNSGIMVTPKIGLNLPLQAPWNNFYVEAAAGWGSTKVKNETGSSTFESKDKTSFYGGTLGYNIFFADQLAFTPMLMYSVYKEESKTTSTAPVQKDKGWSFCAGVRYFLEK